MDKISDNSFNVINIDINNNEVYQGYYNEIFKMNNSNNGISDDNLHYKNFQIIEKYISSKDENENNEFELKLLNYIFDNLYVIEVLSVKQPLSKIIKIFDRLNTTGLDLNSGDLFKYKFAEYLINGDNSKYEETIKKISNQYLLSY